MNLCTGTRWLLARKRSRGEDFRAFLELLHDHYHGWHVALLLDEHPCHIADDSQAMAEEMSIELIWLPNRAPKLNPMDHLWGQGKDIISGNRQYATIDQQVELFVEHLENLTPREALHTSGVLAPHFWLKSSLSKNLCGPA